MDASVRRDDFPRFPLCRAPSGFANREAPDVVVTPRRHEPKDDLVVQLPHLLFGKRELVRKLDRDLPADDEALVPVLYRQHLTLSARAKDVR